MKEIRPEKEHKNEGKESDRKPDDVATSKKKPLKGLCINCDFRDTCTLPKPETGVWYCEEYR